MTKKSQKIIYMTLGGVFFLLTVYCLVRSFTLSFSINIWYDELFSMEFAKRPISELISLTARDVHPPMYYIVLRLFLLAGESIRLVGDMPGQLSPEIMAKITSIVPFVILTIYALTTIRKHFGFLCAGMFSFALMAMPQMPEYTIEIRMYSWGLLFVTGMLLHSFALIRNMLNGETKRWDIPNAIAILIYSVAAAYTHYYAAFCVFIIYAVLFVWTLFEFVKNMKKGGSDRINIRTFATVLICINLTIAAYIPWMGSLIDQITRVDEEYWILPAGIKDFGSAAKHLFMGYFDSYALQVFTAILFLVLSIILFVRTFVRAYKKRELSDILLLFGGMILPLVVTFGVVASIIIRPVFLTRYMIPSYGAFWLSVCAMASREIEELLCKENCEKSAGIFWKAVSVCFVLLMIAVGIADYRNFTGNEKYRKVTMDDTLGLLESISSDTIIISNFNQVQGMLGYYLQKVDVEADVYLYQEEPEVLIKEMVPHLKSMYDPIDIRNYLDSGKQVLFLGSFRSREDLLKDWEEEIGITCENHGSYLMERYWFDVFELK